MEAPALRIVASPEVAREISRRGGLLFVWPRHHGGRFGGVTLLKTSTEPPEEALDYRRIKVGRILVFLSPRLERLPSKLEIALTGWRRKRIAAYWDGCAFAI
jgi:hypothetical protein